MTSSDQHRQSAEERELQTIFSLATPRAAPPEVLTRRVRASVHEEWRRATAGTTRRWPRIAALAAAVILAVAAGFWLRPDATLGVSFEQARLLRVEGPAQLLQGKESVALNAGITLQLAGGARLRTGDAGGLTLDLGASGELRLGANTEVQLVDSEHLNLAKGQLYLATHEVGNAGLIIESEFGRVRHIGTRFQVLVTRTQLHVAVREGAVIIESGRAAPARAEAGSSAQVGPDGDLQINEWAPYGADWDWVDQLAPPFAIDGRSLHEAASWAADQTGRQLVFADNDVEREALVTTLHGDLTLTDPLTGLRNVMLTTRLQFALQGDQIYVSARP